MARVKSQVDPKWLRVDWGKPNRVIAEELGLSKQRVHQMRHRLGMPLAPAGELRRAAMVRLARTRTAGEIAAELGVSVNHVYRELRVAGVRAVSANAKPRPDQWRYDWGSVDWVRETNAEIAARLGCDDAVVAMFRKRRGKPRGPDGRTRAHKALRAAEAVMPPQRAERPPEASAASREGGGTSRMLSEALMRFR